MPYLFTSEEYADMVFILGYCNGNARAAVVEYELRYPNRRIPDTKTISGTFRTLRETGSLPSTRTNYERAVQLDDDIVINAVHRSPGVSTRRISRRIGVSQSTVWRSLNRNKFYPFHKQKVQHLQPGDGPLRLEFCNFLNINNQLYKRILFTDEAQFTRDGVNNLHNEHSWAEENPHEVVEQNFQHRFSVNVWCGLLHNRLIGPFILPGRLNAELYLHFLQEELPQLLENVPLRLRQNLYFQHDGAPPHFSRAVSAYLNHQFPGHWIGRGGPHPWPPRSPDLSPLDYCIWGWMKDIVYKTKVNSRDELIARIMDSAVQIQGSPEKLRNATKAIHKRAAKCIDNDGLIFEHLL